MLEVAALLTEVGRKAVAVPALATLMTGVLPIARWGDDATKRALLPAAAAGETIISAATRETGTTSTTTVDHTQGVITGTKIGVPYAAEAGRILVSAGIDVVLVDPAAPGVTITATPSSSGDPEYTVRLDQAPVAGTLAMEARDLHRLATAGACCLADGALAGALALTRDYIATRRQFGRALAEFQAVSVQIADVYITSRTLHLITLSACWRLAVSLDPDSDLDAAAWWVTEEAVRSVLSCHHMHGGVGVDISYPLHRFSSLIRDLSRFLGGASVH